VSLLGSGASNKEIADRLIPISQLARFVEPRAATPDLTVELGSASNVARSAAWVFVRATRMS